MMWARVYPLRRRVALWLCPELDRAVPVVVVAPTQPTSRAASKSQLLILADAWSAHRGVSLWRVSALCRAKNGRPGDGQFFDRLHKGRDCTLSTAQQVVAWFSDHWPADLPWPADIPRPAPTRSEDAA